MSPTYTCEGLNPVLAQLQRDPHSLCAGRTGPSTLPRTATLPVSQAPGEGQRRPAAQPGPPKGPHSHQNCLRHFQGSASPAPGSPAMADGAVLPVSCKEPVLHPGPTSCRSCQPQGQQHSPHTGFFTLPSGTGPWKGHPRDTPSPSQPCGTHTPLSPPPRLPQPRSGRAPVSAPAPASVPVGCWAPPT